MLVVLQGSTVWESKKQWSLGFPKFLKRVLKLLPLYQVTSGFGIPVTLQMNFMVCPSLTIESVRVSSKHGAPATYKLNEPVLCFSRDFIGLLCAITVLQTHSMEVCCAVANLEGLWARTSGWALNELEVWLFGLYLDARARYPRIGHPLRPCPSNWHHSATQEEKSFFISRATYILINSCNSHQKSFGPKITPAHDLQILVRNELCTLEERGSNTSHCTIILPTIRFLLKLNYLHVCIILCKMTFILFLKTYNMDWVLRSLLVLQKTIQSLNRKTWRWWPLSETLVPGASSHTTKEPWMEKSQEIINQSEVLRIQLPFGWSLMTHLSDWFSKRFERCRIVLNQGRMLHVLCTPRQGGHHGKSILE